jgi:hypothetical protein
LLFKDHYLLARCAGGEISRLGWQALEREFIDDVRWWTLAELAACAEPVYPVGLAGLLAELLSGPLPKTPRTLGAPTQT